MPWQLLEEKLLVTDAWTISSAPIDTEYIKIEFVSPQQTERVAVAAFTPEGDRALTQVVRASLEPQILEFKRFAQFPLQRIGFRPWNPTALALQIKIYYWKSVSPETIAFLNRCVGSYSESRKEQIELLIFTLIQKGIWSKLDCFYVFAAPVNADALLNWRQNAFNCQSVNPTTFTADRGINGNASNSYLNTQFNPVVAAGRYSQNSASFGIYSRTNLTELQNYDIGNTTDPTTGIRARRATSIAWGVNSNNRPEGTVTTPNSLGLHSVSRLNATSMFAYRDGIEVGQALADNSVAPASQTFLICATRTAAGAVQLYSGKQYASAFIGSGLTQQEHLELYTALQTYLASIGASV